MPITSLTTALGGITMFICWLAIRDRMKANPGSVSPQVRYLHNFCLMFSLFFLAVCIPQLWLVFNPAQFPIAMAWGYVIGHVFLYFALAFVALTFASMVPRLSGLGTIIMSAVILFTIIVTLINIKTMPLGTLPAYDAAHGIVKLNAAPAVGAAIGLIAMVTTLPLVILLIINCIRNPKLRVRSFILAAGFLLLIVAGPMHDNARVASMYSIADILSILSFLVITTGVLYRFETKLALNKAAVSTAVNTAH